LEQGSFRWPSLREGVMRLTPAQLSALLEGLDWIRDTNLQCYLVAQ
jgi:transposase